MAPVDIYGMFSSMLLLCCYVHSSVCVCVCVLVMILINLFFSQVVLVDESWSWVFIGYVISVR